MPPETPFYRRRSAFVILAISIAAVLGVYGVKKSTYLQRVYDMQRVPWERWDRSSTKDDFSAIVSTVTTIFRGSDFDSASTRQPLVALTFDDGPYPLYTAALLATLRRYHIKATFFLVGRRVQEFPELARLIAKDGHEIANHTYDHRREKTLSQSELKEDILRNEALLVTVTHVRPHIFRPAGGRLSSEGQQAVRELGYTVLNYTVNPGDWWVHSPQDLLTGLFRGRSREGVVLLHTGNLSTVRVLPLYIELMKAKGFQFVTASELIARTDAPLPPSLRLRAGEGDGVLSSRTP